MSEILVDNLTGKTSAGDITVTSEGGAATQSLQQGLAKAYFSYNQATDTLATGTLNISSATDKATGKFNVTYSNGMSQASHIVTYLADAANYHWDEGEDARTTTNTGTFLNWNSAHSSNIDTQFSTAASHGDLA